MDKRIAITLSLSAIGHVALLLADAPSGVEARLELDEGTVSLDLALIDLEEPLPASPAEPEELPEFDEIPEPQPVAEPVQWRATDAPPSTVSAMPLPTSPPAPSAVPVQRAAQSADALPPMPSELRPLSPEPTQRRARVASRKRPVLPTARKAVARGGVRTRASSSPHNEKPRYPRAARKKGIEGSPIVEVEILADGRVGKVRLVRSSGHEILDREALRAVRRYRFEPARVDGRPVASTWRQKIEFRL